MQRVVMLRAGGNMQSNWKDHRKRWLDRVRSAEKKAAHIENEVHGVLDEIDEGKADIERIKTLLLRAIQYANTVT